MIQPILNHLSDGREVLSLLEPSCMPPPSPNTHTPPVREALTVLLLPLEGLKLGSIPLPGEDFWCAGNVPFFNFFSHSLGVFLNSEQFVEQNSFLP